MKAQVILFMALLGSWSYSLKAQSALVARISERKQTTTTDLRNLAWLEADKSYWVMGCDTGGGFLVMHDSGLAVKLPKDARFRIVNGGKYDESSPIRVNDESAKFNKHKGNADYKATIDHVPSNGFVAVQIYADNEPCGAGVQQITDKQIAVNVDFKAVGKAVKLTYSAHYFVNGNELHQEKPANGW